MNFNNKKVIMLLPLLIVIVALVFVLFFVIKPNQNSVQTANNKMLNNTVQTNEAVTPESIKTPENSNLSGTILDLLNQGKSLQCTFSSNTDKSETTGTMYIANSRMAGEISIKTGETSINSNVITDAGYLYVWNSALNMGIKMQIDTKATDDGLKSNSQLKDFYANYNYNCNPWTVDDSKFSVPTNVKFSDFSSVVSNSKTTTNSAACSACDLITDTAAKAQCKTSLGC